MNKEDSLKFKYEALGKWIENADLKAQILIGIELFIVGFVLGKQFSFDVCHLLSGFFLTLFLLLSGISLFYLYRIIKPRLSNEIHGSRIYFRDIAKNSKADYKKTKESLTSETEEGFVSDLADQIISLSRVCNSKYEDLLSAEGFMIASFLLGLILYLSNT